MLYVCLAALILFTILVIELDVVRREEIKTKKTLIGMLHNKKAKKVWPSLKKTLKR